MFAATTILNAAAVITWLFPRQLVDLGFPNDPVLWYSALGIASFIVGAIAVRLVEARIDRAGTAERIYVLACLLGLVVLATAPDALVGCAGVLLANGIAFSVTRPVSVIWVNRRTTSDVRATVHSFLSQAEYLGKTVGGIGLAILAGADGISPTLLASGALIGLAGAIVARALSGPMGRT
jgi:hypothetical protein